MSTVQAPQFLYHITETDQFPFSHRTEVAFVGRSNVGKSSLINALTNSHICRTSKTPGRTQGWVFFAWHDVWCVDTPGYGYAQVPRHLQKKWRDLGAVYFDRPNVDRAVLVCDGRHAPKQLDEMMAVMLREKFHLPFFLVTTKHDDATHDFWRQTSLEVARHFGAEGWLKLSVRNNAVDRSGSFNVLRDWVLQGHLPEEEGGF